MTLVIISALLVAGCASQTDLTAEQIKQNTIEKFETVNNYVYTMNITSPNNDMNYVISEV